MRKKAIGKTPRKCTVKMGSNVSYTRRVESCLDGWIISQKPDQPGSLAEVSWWVNLMNHRLLEKRIRQNARSGTQVFETHVPNARTYRRNNSKLLRLSPASTDRVHIRLPRAHLSMAGLPQAFNNQLLLWWTSREKQSSSPLVSTYTWKTYGLPWRKTKYK